MKKKKKKKKKIASNNYIVTSCQKFLTFKAVHIFSLIILKFILNRDLLGWLVFGVWDCGVVGCAGRQTLCKD